MSRTDRIEFKQHKGVYSALGYRSSDSSRLDGVSFSGGSGDEHMLYDRVKLIHQSRGFYRNNAIYKGIIDRAVSYIVGQGFHLQMNSRSKSYNDTVEKLWKAWFKRPEIRNLQSGQRAVQMTCREVVLCGDATSIKTDKSLIQLIEAEQVCKKAYGYMDDGIEKDRYGRPTKFHITSYNKNGGLDGRTTRKIDPRYVVFITNPDRPSATRGVPAMQASFPMLHRINDVCDSEAIAWQLLSRLAASIERESSPEQAYGESGVDPSATDGDLSTRLTDVGYAMLFNAKPGEKITGIERNIPGKDFTASIRMFMRLLGLPLGMPLELVLLDWTQSNYSQTRAVLWQSYHQTFLDWQDLIADFWYDDLLEWNIEHWIQSGLIKRRPDGLEHNWIRPTYPWLEQHKEAQAYALRMDRGFGTYAHVCKSLNMDREEVVAARVNEVKDAIGRASAIEKETGVKVPWQIFAGLKADTAADNTPNTTDDDMKDNKNKKDDDE